MLENFQQLAIDVDSIVNSKNVVRQNAEYGVLFEQMSHCFDIAKVINRNDLDWGLCSLHRTKEITTDTTETVDTYTNWSVCHRRRD